MTGERQHEGKAPVEDHVQRVRDRLKQGYRMELEAPDGLAHEIIGNPETLQAIADRLDTRALGPALDRVIAEVEALEGKGKWAWPVDDDNKTIWSSQLVQALRALRAETSAPDAHTRAEAEAGAGNTGD